MNNMIGIYMTTGKIQVETDKFILEEANENTSNILTKLRHKENPII